MPLRSLTSNWEDQRDFQNNKMNRNPYESMVESRGEIGHGLVWGHCTESLEGGAKFGGLKWRVWLLLPGATPCHHCAFTVLFKWYLRSEVLPNVHITSRAPSRLRSLPAASTPGPLFGLLPDLPGLRSRDVATLSHVRVSTRAKVLTH